MELKNSGIVMAWPMPMSRSRDRASPAMLMDRQAKNVDPRTTNTPTPRSLTGLAVSATPSSAESATITTAWTRDRTPEAKAFPVISAALGVGVTMSLVRTPASRSQMNWMP